MTENPTQTYWQIAGQVCTPKELEALKLRDLHEMGQRRIAMHLDISRGAVRERLDNADRKISAALGKEAA